MYDEPISPNEGGVFKIQDEPELSNEGACATYYGMSRYRQMRGPV